MVCNRSRVDRRKIKLKDKVIQEVEEFNYLGSKIRSYGRSGREIVSRVNQAISLFTKKKNLLTLETVSLKGKHLDDCEKRREETYSF